MMLQTVTGSIPEGKPHLPSGPICISEVQAHSLEACKGQTDVTSCVLDITRNFMTWLEPSVNWSNSYIGQIVRTLMY